MIDSIAGAFAALKGASEIAQGLLALKTESAVTAKVLELNRIIADVQSQLFTAQADYATALSRIRHLEAEIAQFEHWAHEKERYQLHELAPGTLVYRVKTAMQGGEPVHDLCPRCYQEGVKSLLQAAGVKENRHASSCPKCASVFLGEHFEFLAETAPRHNPYRGF